MMLLCMYSNNAKIVKLTRLLITYGADVNQTDENGMNALMHGLCEESTSDEIIEVSNSTAQLK